MKLDTALAVAQVIEPVLLVVATKVLRTVRSIDRKLDQHERLLRGHTRRIRTLERHAS